MSSISWIIVFEGKVALSSINGSYFPQARFSGSIGS
jgi:hypothetical protein